MSANKNRGSVGFIGGGRIVRIILDAWKKQGNPPEDIRVSDAVPDVLQALLGAHPSIDAGTENSRAAAWMSSISFQ